MELYELERAAESPTGLTRIGGLPPIAAASWPHDDDGRPFVHLLTVEGTWIGRPDLACVCVFGTLDGDVESDYAGNERPFPVVMLGPEQPVEGEAPADGTVLPAASLRRLGPTTLTVTKDGDAFVCAIHTEGSDDLTTEPGASEHAAVLRALETLYPDSPDSYIGVASYNPSLLVSDTDEFRANELAQRGAFWLQMSGRLFGDAGVDFCGGGWMFVHANGAWVEQ